MRTIFYLAFSLLLLPVTTSGQAPIQVSMDDFFGINITGAQNRPNDIANIAQWVRHYSRWAFYEPENNNFIFTQADYKGFIYDHDAYYRALKEQNIQTLQVIMKSTDWASSSPDAEFPQEYAPSGNESGLEPAHYSEIAEFYYQFIARYGSKTHHKDQLLTPDKVTGLDLLDVVEVDNEPDGPWHNHMSLQQYAALLNAVYDGNRGALGPGYGIKAADPDMPVSVGGVAFKLDALKKIVEYAGRAPFDIVNVHFYCFKYIRENYRVAIPPEWSSLEADMQDIVCWRDEEIPGKPVWLTEIGWDTKAYKTEQVSEQEAADYLIRSYLIALGAGVEKVFWFIMRDLDDLPNPTTFSSSGLFENAKVEWAGDTRFKPKLTYWYNATFKAITAGYYFHRKTPTSDPAIYQYEFLNEDQSKKLIIAWTCPPFQLRWHPVPPVRYRPEYLLESGSDWKVLQARQPIGGTTDGRKVPIQQEGSSMAVDLSGTPVFIELERK